MMMMMGNKTHRKSCDILLVTPAEDNTNGDDEGGSVDVAESIAIAIAIAIASVVTKVYSC